MKINRMILFLFGVSLCGCFDDKGNYDYRDMADITIENVPEVIEVLGNSDRIIVTPKVISSLDGEVKEDNGNFEFSYKIEKKSGGTDGCRAEVGGFESFENLKFGHAGGFCGRYVCRVVCRDRQAFGGTDVDHF